MKRISAQGREVLAGEYVLGTLRGAARRRFEHWLVDDTDLRRLVRDWQERLQPMAEAVVPVRPPVRVWKAIQRRVQARRRKGLWDYLPLWRAIGLSCALAALSLALVIGLKPVPTPAPRQDYLAVVNDQKSQPAWFVEADLGAQVLRVRSLRPQALPPGKAFELWMLPSGGQPPQSLGLLSPTGELRLSLNAAKLVVLTRSQGLAVSLEPAGGSPTGAPTGPVLYQGPLIAQKRVGSTG
jgi:anti-sigma-K factor RskA